jgi:hypothetical protein
LLYHFLFPLKISVKDPLSNSQSVDIQQIQQMFEKMYEEKRKNEEQASLEFDKGDDILTTITQIMI